MKIKTIIKKYKSEFKNVLREIYINAPHLRKHNRGPALAGGRYAGQKGNLMMMFILNGYVMCYFQEYLGEGWNYF